MGVGEYLLGALRLAGWPATPTCCCMTQKVSCCTLQVGYKAKLFGEDAAVGERG